MRIISGKFRSKNIIAPVSLPARPTTDFAKTALFNILHNYFDFEEIKVLDLFCGTGNISYEFVSRGCELITCVDENIHCVKFVKDTLEKLQAKKSSVIRQDAFMFSEKCEEQFDIIFADPPFELSGIEKLPSLILKNKLLKKNGWFILEHQSDRELQSEIKADEARKYGNCAFSIFKEENFNKLNS